MFKSRGMIAADSAVIHLLGQFKTLSKLCKLCYHSVLWDSRETIWADLWRINCATKTKTAAVHCFTFNVSAPFMLILLWRVNMKNRESQWCSAICWIYTLIQADVKQGHSHNIHTLTLTVLQLCLMCTMLIIYTYYTHTVSMHSENWGLPRAFFVVRLEFPYERAQEVV